MDGLKKWLTDNQVLSGLAAAVLTIVGGVIAYFYQRRRKASPTASPTIQQTGIVGTGNIFNVQGPVNNLAVGSEAPVSPPAEQVRVDVKEAISEGRRMSGYVGAWDDSGREHTSYQAWTPVPACLRIVCHNLTGTPATIDQIRLVHSIDQHHDSLEVHRVERALKLHQ